MTMATGTSRMIWATPRSTASRLPTLTDSLDVDATAYVRFSGISSGSARAPRVEGFSNATMFSVLADWWHEATDVLPPRQKIEHTAYQRIVEYGEPMVPHILRDLRERGGDWYVALRQITNEWPVQPQDEGFRPRMREAWYQWGVDNGYVV